MQMKFSRDTISKSSFRLSLFPSKRKISRSLFMLNFYDKRNLQMQSLKMKLFHHHHQQHLVTTNAVNESEQKCKNKSYKRALVAFFYSLCVSCSDFQKKLTTEQKNRFPFTSQTIEIKLSEKVCERKRKLQCRERSEENLNQSKQLLHKSCVEFDRNKNG